MGARFARKLISFLIIMKRNTPFLGAGKAHESVLEFFWRHLSRGKQANGMRTLTAMLVSIFLWAPLCTATELWVSVDGDDAALGTHSRPFATLERARDAIRDLKESPGLPAGGVTVWIGAGVHERAASLELSAEDSGTAAAAIVYRAVDGTEARLSGGRIVDDWRVVDDAKSLARLDPAARGKVLRADLRTAGVGDLGTVASGSRRLEVFFDDQPMQLARWPNDGFVRIADVVGAKPHVTHGIRGNKEGKFTFEGNRPLRWTSEPDAWLHGYWFWDWSDAYQKIASIDTEKRVLSTVPPYHGYGYRKGQRYYALNLLAELDRPGEWYVDRDAATLYFWPPAAIASSTTVVSVAPSLVVAKDCSHVTIRGLVLEATRAEAVRVTGGRHFRIAGCTVRNTGAWGVRISGGSDHAVVGCDIYRTGEGGIALSGGNRKTLAPARNAALNCWIHHFGRLYRTYRPAVGIGGVGNRIAHCRIHDGPHNAIQLGGNDHVIEFNEISRVCFETGDVGAFYMGRDWTQRGTVIRHNYFHDIKGPGLHGAMGVYLDDSASGMEIIGNVFWKASRAAFIGGGRDNTVENNIFVDCNPSVHVDARGVGWMRYHIETTLPDRLKAMPYRSPPWSERYPQLLTVLEDDPGLPKGNAVRRNISVGGKWLGVEKVAMPLIEFEDNLVGKDPQFVGAERGDFRLRADSPALALGFRPIPFDEIGLQTDEHRPLAPKRLRPPGPHVRPVARSELRSTAFGVAEPIVGTYYFYWYDIETTEHFVDHDGTDALTRHPATTEGYSYRKASWHRRELEDVAAAGLDFVLPVYWGWPGGYRGWSFVGLPPLVEAARAMARDGKKPPRIGCFYDTSTLRHNGKRYHADLSTVEGKEWLYTTARDFFALIPPDLWATIDGRPLLWLYSAAFAKVQDPKALDWLRREFQHDFGVEPFIVKEISWQGRADATYAWGAALKPTVYGIAAVGPGYDHAAVPGRTPLVREREGGAFYRRSWEWILARPLTMRPRIAIVETWNEWHEGTDIAPSTESGRQYVDLTREYADLWHRGTVVRPSGGYGSHREVSITLGAQNKSKGITQNDEPDGKTRVVVVHGESGRETAATKHGGRYIYFDVDDAFYWANGEAVEIEVTFLDAGKGDVVVEYDSLDRTAFLDGAFKAPPPLKRRGTGAWITGRIRVEDAAFTGRANRNDLRIIDRDGSLKVRRVAVRKAGR